MMKQTEIGLIPDDWEVITIGEVYDFKNGLNKAKEFFGYGVPIINYTDVYNNKGITKDIIKGKVYLNKDEIKRFNTQKGDVFFTRTSETPDEVGLTSVLLEDIENCVFSGFILRARPKKNLFDLCYCKYCFSTNSIRNFIIQNCTYTTRALTNGTVLSKIYLPLPPLQEQQRIAKALSDVDALISTTEKLIQKKKNIKQGTMQNLLTGKKRLPGFSPQTKTPAYKQTELGLIPEDWDVMSLEEICKRITDGSHESPAEVENGYYMPSVKDMSIRGFDFSECKKISASDYQKLVQNGCKPEIGDVLIAKDGSILKYSFAIEEEMNIVILSSIAILKPNTSFIDSSFLALYFQQEDFIKSVIDNNKTGTGVPRIVLTNFKKINIVIPSKEEQTAIANVLSSMDKEIETLNIKLEKYRNLKTAMMQQLLTGKIRLVK